MNEINDLMRARIIRDMSEGVMALDLDGRVAYMNPAAEGMLGLASGAWADRRFAELFFENSENDAFNQAILDAVYDADTRHMTIVPYQIDGQVRRLNVMSSCLRVDDQKAGVIVVLNDMTEIAEMRTRHLRQVVFMLNSFVMALATAIDERSPYNANHTRHMVQIAEAFLKWLDAQRHPWRFDDIQKRAFIMSVWLHDVGKLVVPQEVMDKATRLEGNLERIEARFERARLVERIAVLEGRLSPEAFAKRENDRQERLSLIRRVNRCDFLNDEDFEAVQRLAGLTYTDDNGVEAPLIMPDEMNQLSVRRGTLTDDEIAVMHSHVTATRRILERVDFPDSFQAVPEWAGAHHELLNGKGYPNHLRADDLPREVRLLTLLDIFEALTAKDRPYKEPLPPEKALNILHAMAREGGIDGDLLALFEESRAWEAVS